MTHDEAFDAQLARMLNDDPVDLDADADRFTDEVLARMARFRRGRLAVLTGAALLGGGIAAAQLPALAARIAAFAGDSQTALDAFAYFGPQAIAALTLGAMLAAFAAIARPEI
jgi:hypothetical protein